MEEEAHGFVREIVVSHTQDDQMSDSILNRDWDREPVVQASPHRWHHLLPLRVIILMICTSSDWIYGAGDRHAVSRADRSYIRGGRLATLRYDGAGRRSGTPVGRKGRGYS
ncbi:uncharacterized protein LOC111392655 [Olea europaea var. sylvestris]|uniref:uncharacterized protein LOC111392655 n=1 Tax=Olea europaea var. sylvestris TaxID=158386 RepID=UPI000C1CEEE7|nr:uncharacterized protein LOC111392655 [Olea europaea var. sylvestris]